MFKEVIMSRDFDLAFQQLQPQKQEIVRRKIVYLLADPSHSSLNAHRLKQAGEDIWECYIDQGMRLLYEIQQNILRLWYLGGHVIVDRARKLSFNHDAKFLFWQAPVDPLAALELPTSEVPAPVYRDAQFYAAASRPLDDALGNSNAFAYFREAYLRVLGVPGDLVQAVKEAQTTDEVLGLPGLPEPARNHLLDVATSPKMKTVLLDPSQLLYRTRLDRLDGYFEGRIKKLMLNLEPDQQQYVDLKHIPLLLLKGTAGCGKTTIGIYRAIRLAEEGRRVLVVTYNSTLASVTKTLIEELIGPLPDNLEVKTAHSVMTSLLGSRFHRPGDSQLQRARQYLHEAIAEGRATDATLVLKRDDTFFSDEIQHVIKGLGLVSVDAYKAIRRYGRKTALGPVQREAVWRVYEAYQKRLATTNIHEWADAALLVLEQATRGPLGRLYDDIVVDEAQDLKPVDLRVNHRNTCQIAEAASHLIMQNTLMRSLNEYVDPQWTRRAGEKPRLLTSATSHEQIDVVYQQILELLNTQQCRLSDIAVLCPDNRMCQRCKDILVGNGLRAVLRSDREFNILEEQIKIMTIHSAKGLEFPVVFLTSLNEGEFPRAERAVQDEEEAQLEVERARMLCYVGMTRAAEMLYLVTVRGRESRFVRELSAKIEAAPMFQLKDT